MCVVIRGCINNNNCNNKRKGLTEKMKQHNNNTNKHFCTHLLQSMLIKVKNPTASNTLKRPLGFTKVISYLLISNVKDNLWTLVHSFQQKRSGRSGRDSLKFAEVCVVTIVIANTNSHCLEKGTMAMAPILTDRKVGGSVPGSSSLHVKYPWARY